MCLAHPMSAQGATTWRLSSPDLLFLLLRETRPILLLPPSRDGLPVALLSTHGGTVSRPVRRPDPETSIRRHRAKPTDKQRRCGLRRTPWPTTRPSVTAPVCLLSSTFVLLSCATAATSALKELIVVCHAGRRECSQHSNHRRTRSACTETLTRRSAKNATGTNTRPFFEVPGVGLQDERIRAQSPPSNPCSAVSVPVAGEGSRSQPSSLGPFHAPSTAAAVAKDSDGRHPYCDDIASPSHVHSLDFVAGLMIVSVRTTHGS